MSFESIGRKRGGGGRFEKNTQKENEKAIFINQTPLFKT
jgi:hypothetical protein